MVYSDDATIASLCYSNSGHASEFGLRKKKKKEGKKKNSGVYYCFT